jgi:hypothetical protein
MQLGTVRLKSPVVGGFSAGICVALLFSSLYFPQVSCRDLFLLGVCICRTGAMVIVCDYFLWVCSQVAWDYSCGSACTCALINIRCLVLLICDALYCLVCGWLIPLGSSLASIVECSLFVHLITPYSLLH